MAGIEDKLVTQGTLFRDLKYGQDRPGGGSSKEPFIQKDLPSIKGESPDLGLLGGNANFLLRAGTLKRQIDDVSRITELLITTGKGNLFTAKQNLLSRTNVKTQAESIGLNQGPYLPTSTIAQVGTAGLGFHLNKQGINPFAKTGVDSGDDGSGGNLLQRIVDAGSLPTYLSANVKGGDAGDTNRLVQLTKYKITAFQDTGLSAGVSRGTRLISNIAGQVDNVIGTDLKSKVLDLVPNVNPELAANSISNARDILLAYGGGPGAEIGIGRTRIRRFDDTTAFDTQEFRKKYYLLDNTEIKNLADNAVVNPGKIGRDFRSLMVGRQEEGFGGKKNLLTNSPDYETKNIERRVGLNDPGKNNKDTTSYTKGLGRALDEVNSLPLYQSTGVTANPRKNDLIKFRIAAINPHDGFKKTYIHFRAFIDSFNDSYSSDWNSFKYMGRSENFYKFQGFNREVSLSWKIAAQSREELIPMYKKLNYLQSIMTGDYSKDGYMEGNLVDLTVGGYLWEQPGFFTSLQITFPDKSPYEIGIPDNVEQSEFNTNQTIGTSKAVKELPHYLEVSAGFTPIQKFVPRKQQNTFDDKGGLKTFGEERFINLSSEGGASSYQDAGDDYFDPTRVDRSLQTGIQPSKLKPFQTQGIEAPEVDLSTVLGIARG